ncbi:MAG: hypothetical protein HQL90_04590 [Magnetococcales bacterium]|nr:hypothetical protein [Magnetococcales bacterium]
MDASVQTKGWLGRSGGFSFITLMLMIGMAGALFSMAAATFPKLYECFLLRELADRVTHEYARLPLEEVQRRVKFEMYRSRIVVPQETFKILPIGHGYRVTVHHVVPLELRFGDKIFTWEGHERWEFVYEVES